MATEADAAVLVQYVRENDFICVDVGEIKGQLIRRFLIEKQDHRYFVDIDRLLWEGFAREALIDYAQQAMSRVASDIEQASRVVEPVIIEIESDSDWSEGSD